jgi:hypothetical protein
MALSAARRFMTSWIPAFTGIPEWQVSHAVSNYVKLNNKRMAKNRNVLFRLSLRDPGFFAIF